MAICNILSAQLTKNSQIDFDLYGLDVEEFLAIGEQKNNIANKCTSINES